MRTRPTLLLSIAAPLATRLAAAACFLAVACSNASTGDSCTTLAACCASLSTEEASACDAALAGTSDSECASELTVLQGEGACASVAPTIGDVSPTSDSFACGVTSCDPVTEYCIIPDAGDVTAGACAPLPACVAPSLLCTCIHAEAPSLCATKTVDGQVEVIVSGGSPVVSTSPICGGADLLSDPDNCGSCGNICDSGASCADGECQAPLPVCASEQCDGECVDIESDPNNCGGCGAVCDSGMCTSGTCSCPAGQETCDEGCTDLETDPNNCGVCRNACTAGETCEAGSCTCTGGTCDGVCTDLANDANNCGACGNVCQGSIGFTGCVQGMCESSS